MNRAWNGPAAIAAGLLIALLAGAWLMHETRGTTLWFDEWLWALEYRDGLHTFIAPHNGHPTLVPFTIYRLLFSTVGIDHSAPYRVVGIAGHLLVVALLYVYAARRAGAAVGFLAAGSILLLGPGWQNIIWPLQIGWPISIACGLGALLALDRRDRRGDIAACVLLVICVSGVRPRRRDRRRADRRGAARPWAASAWIVGVPLALFVVWYLAYPGQQLRPPRAGPRARLRGRLRGGHLQRAGGAGRPADRRRPGDAGLGPAARGGGRRAARVARCGGSGRCRPACSRCSPSSPRSGS